MLAHLAQASRRPARSWLALPPRRHYAAKTEGGPDDPFTQGPTYATWLRTEGVKYKEAHRPNNWLGGGKVPFPLNPSFKPPPPISDAIRTEIWNDYMRDPVKSNVRQIARSYGISIARVDAILRLKGLEEHWKKEGKELQTGFLSGMEFSLGVTENRRAAGIARAAASELGQDAVEADEVSEVTKDVARARYQRLFWEPVVEGKEPKMTAMLSQAAVDAAESHKAGKEALLKRLRNIDPDTQPDVVVERPGRPVIRFVDVGVKFVDVKDRLKRVQAAKRRSLLKRKHKALDASALGEAPAATQETVSA